MEPNGLQLGCREQQFIHLYIQGGGLGEGKSKGEELRSGQAAGTSTSVPAEEALAVPTASCLCWKATGICKQKHPCSSAAYLEKKNQLASIPHSLVTLKQGTTTTLCISPTMPRNTDQYPVIKETDCLK